MTCPTTLYARMEAINAEWYFFGKKLCLINIQADGYKPQFPQIPLQLLGGFG
jgi:hypothetical protein